MAGTIEPRLGIWVQAELGAGAAAEEHETGPLAARDIRGVVIGDKILEQAAAEGRRFAGLEEAEVLDQIGHAPQRAVGKPGSDSLARLLVLLVHNGINGRIDLFGPCDRRLQHLFGADLALGDEPGEGDSVMLAVFVKPHSRPISNIKVRGNDDSYSDCARGLTINRNVPFMFFRGG